MTSGERGGPPGGQDLLVAVYADRSVATSVRHELLESGVEVGAVRIGARGASEHAEMEQELDDSLDPGFSFAAGTQAANALWTGAVLGVVGVVVGVAAGLAMFDFGAAWLDALAGSAIVAPLFATVGAMIGGGMGAGAATGEAVAAQRGVPVEVRLPRDATPWVREILQRWSPRRLDEFRDGQYVATHVDQRPPAPRRLGRGMTDPGAR